MKKDEQKKSFVMYDSFIQAARHLDDKSFKEFILNIRDYALDDNYTESNNPTVNMAMVLVKPTIDSARRRYEASVSNGKKGAALGVLGGRPRKTPEKPLNNPKETPKKPLDVDVYVDDNVYEDVDEYENEDRDEGVDAYVDDNPDEYEEEDREEGNISTTDGRYNEGMEIQEDNILPIVQHNTSTPQIDSGKAYNSSTSLDSKTFKAIAISIYNEIASRYIANGSKPVSYTTKEGTAKYGITWQDFSSMIYELERLGYIKIDKTTGKQGQDINLYTPLKGISKILKYRPTLTSEERTKAISGEHTIVNMTLLEVFREKGIRLSKKASDEDVIAMNEELLCSPEFQAIAKREAVEDILLQLFHYWRDNIAE